jgi:hypothetical protein
VPRTQFRYQNFLYTTFQPPGSPAGSANRQSCDAATQHIGARQRRGADSAFAIAATAARPKVVRRLYDVPIMGNGMPEQALYIST